MLLLWGLLFLVGAAGIAWKARDNIALGLAAPLVVDADRLTAADAAGLLEHRLITFTTPEVVNTLVTESYVNRRDRVLARYFVVRAGDRWLLIKGTADQQGDTFTGLLTDISPSETERAIGAFARSREVDPARLLPFLLDCTLDTSRGLVVGLFFLAVFLVPGLVLTGLGLWRILRPEGHALARALRRFGPPAEVAVAIDRSGQPVRVGPLEFAGDWLVCRSPRGAWIVFRHDDLLWVHKLVETVNRTTYHQVKIYDRLGAVFVGGGQSEEMDAVVDALTERNPWLVVGWDERVEKQWREDPASLVPRVEERREELRQKALGQANSPPRQAATDNATSADAGHPPA
jgi:hypothetical protein